MNILIHRSEDRQFYFIIKAENNKTIATSETYKSKAGARKGIAAIVRGLKQEKHRILDETK